MHLFIRRLLKLFTTYTVIYQGVGVSNNKFYAGGASDKGWAVRAGLKNKYAKIFKWLLIEAKIPKMQEYAIIMFYRNTQDGDNVIGGTGKVFQDVLKTQWVPDDNYKTCKLVAALYDPTLPNKTIEFKIIKLK